MTNPQQNVSFPDTIAVCLDEDKSVVSKNLLILVFKKKESVFVFNNF
jgi:hypothetical protein